jgi:hypothetical protein
MVSVSVFASGYDLFFGLHVEILAWSPEGVSFYTRIKLPKRCAAGRLQDMSRLNDECFKHYVHSLTFIGSCSGRGDARGLLDLDPYPSSGCKRGI